MSLTNLPRELPGVVRRAGRWLCPLGLYEGIKRRCEQGRPPLTPREAAMVASNVEVRDVGHGKRCFIVCCGPSVAKQNLRLLRGEESLFVSSGYLHPDYDWIAPRYHCLVGIIFSQRLTPDVAREWYRQVHLRTRQADLFIHASDEPFIAANGLFPGRRVRYVHLGRMDWERQQGVADLTGPVPGVQSVAVMSLMVAMYMGYSDIYLLGAEHDSVRTGIYQHFYSGHPDYVNKDCAVGDDGSVTVPLIEEAAALVSLWRQYEAIKRIADEAGIRVYNATCGGALDVFPRVDYAALFG